MLPMSNRYGVEDEETTVRLFLFPIASTNIDDALVISYFIIQKRLRKISEKCLACFKKKKENITHKAQTFTFVSPVLSAVFAFGRHSMHSVFSEAEPWNDSSAYSPSVYGRQNEKKLFFVVNAVPSCNK